MSKILGFHPWPWKFFAFVAIVTAVYWAIVWFFGYTSLEAFSIQFGRVGVAIGVLVIYIPLTVEIFREVPAPRRDYLVAGIILSWFSTLGFSLSNVAGKVFGMDTSVFTSAIAGFLSLLLLLGGIFHFIAPSTSNVRLKMAAVALAIVGGFMIVFGVPMLFAAGPVQNWLRLWTWFRSFG